MGLYAPYRLLFLNITKFGIDEMRKLVPRAETSQGVSNYRTGNAKVLETQICNL